MERTHYHDHSHLLRGIATLLLVGAFLRFLARHEGGLHRHCLSLQKAEGAGGVQ